MRRAACDVKAFVLAGGVVTAQLSQSLHILGSESVGAIAESKLAFRVVSPRISASTHTTHGI